MGEEQEMSRQVVQVRENGWRDWLAGKIGVSRYIGLTEAMAVRDRLKGQVPEDHMSTIVATLSCLPTITGQENVIAAEFKATQASVNSSVQVKESTIASAEATIAHAKKGIEADKSFLDNCREAAELLLGKKAVA